MEQETLVLVTLAACSIGTLFVGAFCSRKPQGVDNIDDDQNVRRERKKKVQSSPTKKIVKKKTAKELPKKSKKQPLDSPTPPSRQVELVERRVQKTKKGKKSAATESLEEKLVAKEEDASSVVIEDEWSVVTKRPKTPKAPADLPSQTASTNAEKTKRTDRITEFVPIDKDDIGRVVGKAGANVKKIEKITGARISISTDSPREVVIRGLPAQVASAKEKVQESLIKTDKPQTEEPECKEAMDLKTHQNRLALIGIKGSNIRKLEHSSGATFAVDRDTNHVVISGDAVAVEKGKGLVEALLRDSAFEKSVAVPADSVGAVLGKGGSRIRSIESESKTRLKLIRAKDGAPGKMVITGPEQNVLQAEALILKSLEMAGESLYELKKGEVKEERELGENVRAVVGREGKSIKKIQEESGAVLKIGKNSTKCVVIGTPEALAKANALVDEVIAKREKIQARQLDKLTSDSLPETTVVNLQPVHLSTEAWGDLE